MQNTKWHPFLIDAGSVYTTCALFSFLFFFMIFGDRSPSEYLYSVVPRNVLFAQRRVARLNFTRHAAATAVCSRGSRGGGGFGGGGCGTAPAAAEGRGLGSGSIASWLWSADRVWGALEVLAERSAQPTLS